MLNASVPQVSCSYQINSINCLENRILKTTLLKINSYFKSIHIAEPEMENLLTNALYDFQEVESIEINFPDFSRLHGNPFFKEYKPALELAKIILKRFSYSNNLERLDQTRYTIPFYINMPELFERYCEVLLRSQYKNVKAGYQRDGKSETRSGKFKIRPDFLLPDENMIVDSKYKYWLEPQNISKEDISQLSLYSRHEGILKKLGKNSSRPTLQFIYPKDEGEQNIDFSNSANKKEKEIIDCFRYPLNICLTK